MRHEPFNESMEMYLKTVSELAVGEDPVPISGLAKRLEVSTVSATEMVHRLSDQGLIEHTPYKGVQLTLDGSRRAFGVIRRHRLWERFLVDQLGLPWGRAHEMACRLEHATDREVTEALAVFLDHPQTCPHGNPIPTADGVVEVPADVALTEMAPGRGGVISRIHPESTLVLDYLGPRGFRPGRCIAVTEIAPFNGPIIVTLDDASEALGQEIAAHIFVTPNVAQEDDESAT